MVWALVSYIGRLWAFGFAEAVCWETRERGKRNGWCRGDQDITGRSSRELWSRRVRDVTALELSELADCYMELWKADSTADECKTRG